MGLLIFVMKGQTSIEYLLLLGVSFIITLVVILGVGKYFDIIADLSSYVKAYTANVGVDLRAAKIYG